MNIALNQPFEPVDFAAILQLKEHLINQKNYPSSKNSLPG